MSYSPDCVCGDCATYGKYRCTCEPAYCTTAPHVDPNLCMRCQTRPRMHSGCCWPTACDYPGPCPGCKPAEQPILLGTELVIVWLSREGVEPQQAREFIYNNSARSRLTNYGGTTRSSALWDLRQVRALMWPKAQDQHPIDSGELSDIQ